MTENATPAPATASPAEAAQHKQSWRVAVIVLGALALVAAVVAGGYALVIHPQLTAALRDISIIVLALVTGVIGLFLAILVFQLQSLIGLLRDEIKPILASVNQTAGTLKGTTTFVSEAVVTPVISAASYASGVRQVLRVLATGKSRCAPGAPGQRPAAPPAGE